MSLQPPPVDFGLFAPQEPNGEPEYSIDLEALCADPDERRVARELNDHRGQAEAIRVPVLAARVGLPTRQVQEIVHHLIHVHDASIGTSMRPPYGNFLAVSAAERQEAARLHRSRGIAELVTAAKLERIDKQTLLQQVQTELEVN